MIVVNICLILIFLASITLLCYCISMPATENREERQAKADADAAVDRLTTAHREALRDMRQRHN